MANHEDRVATLEKALDLPGEGTLHARLLHLEKNVRLAPTSAVDGRGRGSTAERLAELEQAVGLAETSEGAQGRRDADEEARAERAAAYTQLPPEELPDGEE